MLHAGVYYRPGSRKAALCRAGRERMEAFCAAEGLPWTRSGKTIVALSDAERPRLDALADRARANGVEVHALDAAGIQRHEPHAAGVAGLWVPATGVADFGAVAHTLRQRAEDAGAVVVTGAEVVGGRETAAGVVVETTAGAVEARALATCAGLWADRVARLFGAEPGVTLVPFRGEYAVLRPQARPLVARADLPGPRPGLPVPGRPPHAPRRRQPSTPGRARRWRSRATATRWATSAGATSRRPCARGAFRQLARRHLGTGLGELGRSLSLRAFWRAARRLVPDLRLADLARAPSGVRAQALRPDGTLADDFVIAETARAVHVVNAPSPAATASLAIGDAVAALALARLA